MHRQSNTRSPAGNAAMAMRPDGTSPLSELAPLFVCGDAGESDGGTGRSSSTSSRTSGDTSTGSSAGTSSGTATSTGSPIAGRSPRTGTHRRTIDMHCHALCPAVEALLAPHPAKQAEQAAMLAAQGPASAAQNRLMLAEAGQRLTNLGQRLSDMDALGIDIQVLSPAPHQYAYWAEPDLAEEVVRLQNEHIAQLCAAHPSRFAGLGTLALQHPALALHQMDHAVRVLGLRGIEISTQVNGISLADERFTPIWARAEALGCAVLIHPLGSEQGTRLATHYLWNAIGQPLETTIALAQLAMSGTMERHPRLKLCACHGGGYLAAYWGRTDHAWRVRPEARQTPHPPSHYLRRVHADTVVHDPQQLAELIQRHGADRVLLGTDYPYDMGCYQVQGLLDEIPGLSEADRNAIHHGNAERLLSLADGQPFAPGLARFDDGLCALPALPALPAQPEPSAQPALPAQAASSALPAQPAPALAGHASTAGAPTIAHPQDSTP